MPSLDRPANYSMQRTALRAAADAGRSRSVALNDRLTTQNSGRLCWGNVHVRFQANVATMSSSESVSDPRMMKESRLSDGSAKRSTVLEYLVVGVLALLFFACLMHGDGWVTPTIQVQVNDAHGAPIEEATVIFFDGEGRRDTWLHLRKESLSTEDCIPEDSIGATCNHGQTEVQGSFGAAFYLYHTYLGGRGILRVEKPGYLPTEVVIDSREKRQEILNEILELDITLKRSDGNQPHEL